MQEGVLLSNDSKSEIDVFDLTWCNKGYWLLSSKSLDIKDERIHVKQDQLQEVLQYLEFLYDIA